MTDAEQLTQLEQHWMEAWRTKDHQTLESILAPDYTFTLSTHPQRAYSRQEWLDLVSEYDCEWFHFEQVAVRLLEPYAVVSSRFRQRAVVRGQERSGEFFLVDVWRRVEGGWQVAARYSAWPEPMSASVEQLG
ncbi:MAG TPA: nuclear transport factor 2 family protein [Blastocatellia bacterium]|nr:nuclear transport factor 2 family protein [Blastocatellia bacterium]